MQDILRKIDADAGARLQPSARTDVTPDLSRLRGFLKLETHRLKLAHRSGAGGVGICRARSAILDHVIRYLWAVTLNSLSEQARKEFPPITLVALGGYGRGELNPHSDVDLMFLHEGQVSAHRTKPLPVLSKVLNGVWLPLFDIGVKPGHSVRTIEDCVAAANDRNDARSVETRTALIEARYIAGDETLFARFQKAVVAKCVSGYEDKYIAARLRDQADRRAKYGNSACMQEPNLKNGCGGLRDYQNLLWMAYFKYRTRTLAELQEREFVTARERKQLESAYDFLLRVRTELHYHLNRPLDALTRNLQPAVAHGLGYTERSPSVRIERFMRDVYTHTRNIFLITRTLEQRMAFVPEPPVSRLSVRRLLSRRRNPAAVEPIDGFKFVNGEVIAASNRVFRDKPTRLMRVFLYAQQRGLRLHADLAQLIRNQVSLVDREFQNDSHVAETFLEILNQRGNVAPILRAMHEVDFLGKYIPEFGKLTCRVQHEFYHQYAADEHTLVCLEQLDRVWESADPKLKAYSELFQHLERPYLLYLALLLHDTGKPEGRGKHSDVGAKLAMRVAKRLGLDGAATHTLRLVIEHHLAMASVSQRRDMDDPAVIRNFARQMQSPETLALLTLHTYADTMATSDKLWNSFKDSLLWELHRRTMPLLASSTEFIRVEERQRDLLMQEVRALMPKDIGDEELGAHFATLPPRYFQIHSAMEVLNDLLLTHRFMRLQILQEEDNALSPVINWHNDHDRGYSVVKVCSWDRAGLFSKIAGALSAAGLNILNAQIFTRSDGVVIDTFFVTDTRTGSLAEVQQRDKFEGLLTKVLTEEKTDLKSNIQRQRASASPYLAYSGERIPTHILMDNEASDTRTLIEVETEDSIGLLHTIVQALAELDVDISTARICTEKGAAIDTFYVQEVGGGKIQSPERQQVIERRLRRAIAELEKAA
ncbi:MAG TPA: [protein-PII] uridylyltransferase [Verrucomicrobiota bacterium]|nr:[protein-PII] uridylyltransferase [Verrucomicrobiota bacterium]